MKDTQINNSKLRIITRSDLPFSVQAVQAGHAAIDFQHQYPETSKFWQKNSNYLVYLTVKTEQELFKLLRKAESLGIKVTTFFEPDIDNQLTAIALEPSQLSKKVTSSLKLMGREVSYV